MTAWLWIGFVAFVLVMLALDLGVFNRNAHIISTREALRWTAVVATLAMLFAGGIYFIYEWRLFGMGAAAGQVGSGRQAALAFITGYIVEQSLSLDNIFVIALIFAYFGVPRIYQHRLLFWGILGALAMRGAMILAGAGLINRFHAVIYVFGGLLLITALKMMRSDDQKVEPERNPLVRLARLIYPVSGEFSGDRFFTRLNGQRAITPLFVCLIVIESTDVLFAVDSIPAIFAVTTDPFIVFTSNVFAILCLRSMYFALAGMLTLFHHLKTSLIGILAFIGVKMLLTDVYQIPTSVSLTLICLLLLGGVLASVWARRHSAALEFQEASIRENGGVSLSVVRASIVPLTTVSDHPRRAHG